MALGREASIKLPGFVPGDLKIAHYNITFTANQLVEPTLDPGWFLLNGSVVSQTSYPTLFARVGTAYNTGGEGAGNFRLPDFTDGRVPMMRGLTSFPTLGARGGEAAHALTTAEIPSHAHSDTFGFSANPHSHSAGGSTDSRDLPHTHGITSGHFLGSNGGHIGGVASATDTTGSGGTGGSGDHGHSISPDCSTPTSSWSVSGTIDSAGGSAGVVVAHNNMQPFLVVGGWLVKHD